MCWAVSQVSMVQTLPSSQSASTSQQPAIFGKLHAPVMVSHVLTVQASPSSQTTDVPGRQFPVATSQVSTPLQALPSSQKASVEQQVGIDVFRQPPAPSLAVGSQLSAVQTTPSSQVGGGTTIAHAPSTQAATPLQYWLLSHCIGVPT